MPHLTIEYSANVGDWTSIEGLCDRLRREAVATGVFPMAGVRVRAVRCEDYSVADGSPEMGFVDIAVRLRAGRPIETRREVARSLFGAAEDFLKEVMAMRPLALSMEMRELEPELSLKTGTIRKFLKED